MKHNIYRLGGNCCGFYWTVLLTPSDKSYNYDNRKFLRIENKDIIIQFALNKSAED